MTTITIQLPDHQAAALAAKATAQGRAVEDYAAKLLEEAIHAAATAPSQTENESLIGIAKPVRGLLTDAEVDQLFSRNSSTVQPYGGTC